MSRFKEGDKVVSEYFGLGTIINSDDYDDTFAVRFDLHGNERWYNVDGSYCGIGNLDEMSVKHVNDNKFSTLGEGNFVWSVCAAMCYHILLDL